MALLAATVNSGLLMDVAFAAIMLMIGFALGWWLFRDSGGGNSADEMDRAREALGKIQELADSVAQNVGEHTHRVQEISTELSDSGSSDQAVFNTVAQLIEANERMQNQLKTAEERLQQQAEEIEIHATDARTDALTKLINRRGFDDELDRRFVEWNRIQSPYSLVLLDVDHFKKFNDVHGHQAGDEVLRGVARVLRNSVREMDIACRYGGEEFAVIMPATSGDVARLGAERVRAAIEASTFRFEGKQFNVTVSIGLSEIIVGEDNETLIRRTDDALYASKEAGRNNSHFHDGQHSIQIPKNEGQQARSEQDQGSTQQPAADQGEVAENEQPETTTTLERLPDKQTFSNELNRRVAEGKRFNIPLSLILIHVDNFKTFTAQYGTEVGELVLDTVAQYLEILLRDMDLLAKYSGGQFSAMLPGSSLKNAASVATRIQEAISACVIPMGDKKIQLTVSQGIAEMLPSDDTESLVERTDAALFASKAAGHNCVHVHNGESCQPVVLESAASN